MNETNNKRQVLRRLFFSTLYLSAFTFGGGYVIVTLLKKKFVDEYHWIEEDEMLDLVAIAQSAPGAIAVNGAIVVGYKLAGMPGAAVATLGCILPSCIIVTLIAKLYLKYRTMALLQGVLGSLRPAVVALIASAGLSILVTAFWGDAVIALAATNWVMVLIFALSLFLLLKCKLDPILVMVLAGGIAALPLPALVLYQGAWAVLALIFPMLQRY